MGSSSLSTYLHNVTAGNFVPLSQALRETDTANTAITKQFITSFFFMLFCVLIKLVTFWSVSVVTDCVCFHTFILYIPEREEGEVLHKGHLSLLASPA